jgi:hypothetical protein
MQGAGMALSIDRRGRWSEVGRLALPSLGHLAWQAQHLMFREGVDERLDRPAAWTTELFKDQVGRLLQGEGSSTCKAPFCHPSGPLNPVYPKDKGP